MRRERTQFCFLVEEIIKGIFNQRKRENKGSEHSGAGAALQSQAKTCPTLSTHRPPEGAALPQRNVRAQEEMSDLRGPGRLASPRWEPIYTAGEALPPRAQRRNETQSKSVHHETEVAHLISNEASHSQVREDATQPPLTHSARLWAKVGICLAFQLCR